LQQEIAQQIAEVNRVASQTTYNGKNVLDGSAGNVSFQIGANVGQTINLNLTNNLSAASMGTGLVTKGATVGQLTGLSLDNTGAATTGAATPAITTINILSDGQGGFTFTDQNNQALSATASANLFGAANTTTGNGTALSLSAAATGALGTITSVPATASTATTASVTAINNANAGNGTGVAGRAAAGTALGSITGLSLDNAGGFIAAGESGAVVTSINVTSDGNGGFNFTGQSGKALSTAVTTAVFGAQTPATAGVGAKINLVATAIGTATSNISTQGASAVTAIASAAWRTFRRKCPTSTSARHKARTLRWNRSTTHSPR
jgi:flagellin